MALGLMRVIRRVHERARAESVPMHKGGRMSRCRSETIQVCSGVKVDVSYNRLDFTREVLQSIETK